MDNWLLLNIWLKILWIISIKISNSRKIILFNFDAIYKWILELMLGTLFLDASAFKTKQMILMLCNWKYKCKVIIWYQYCHPLIMSCLTFYCDRIHYYKAREGGNIINLWNHSHTCTCNNSTMCQNRNRDLKVIVS